MNHEERDPMKRISESIKNSNVNMSEERFWKIVDGIGWGTLSQEPSINYDAIREKVIKTFQLQPRDVIELRQIAGAAFALLDNFVGDRNPSQGGDDAFSDLMYHIIGLGEHEFYACLADYNRIVSRGKALYGSPEGYRESFSYCLPYEADIQDSEGLKTYDVTIEAIVRKTIRVEAQNKQDAIENAHSLFSVANTDEQERYEEETVGVELVQ